MASAVAAEAQWNDTDTSHLAVADLSGPFEGPEKLLELWFVPSVNELPECADGVPSGRVGLRRVPKSTWEAMLDLVKCKTLSVETSADVDAYLLSESSMFVYPHKIVLKTCGTTTLLLGLDRLLRIAKTALFDEAVEYGTSVSSAVLAQAVEEDVGERQLGDYVLRCFYSRKSFMFPEKQQGPHRDWVMETELLDKYFGTGAAYTVGKMNGDHWLLYMAAHADDVPSGSASTDMTLEILMTELSPEASKQFVFDVLPDGRTALPNAQAPDIGQALDHGHALGKELSAKLGLSSLFPQTQLDAFAFDPCGYSANALVPASPAHAAGYWTVHVTPEAGSSYASFETNIALDYDVPSEADTQGAHVAHVATLVQRVVDMFQPGSFTLTLFVSDESTPLQTLHLAQYRRSDRILYEFEGYNLLFVSFQHT